MRTHAALALISLAVTTQARAEEVTANVGSAGRSTTTVTTSGGLADQFAAPNGQLGAGISLSGQQKIRVYGELAFARAQQTADFFGAHLEQHVNGLNLLIGGAYRILPALEIEAMLPIAWTQYGGSTTYGGQTESNTDGGFVLQNLHVGVNYLRAGQLWRLKVGGALEWGPWAGNPEDRSGFAFGATHAAYGGENFGLWAPSTFSIVAPVRFEYGERLVVSGDALVGIHIGTGDADSNFSLQLAPGLGYYATDTILVGMRLPFTWIPTADGDNTFFAIQPYGRFDFGNAFLDASFMLNIDDPYGFAFDSGKFWGLHIGGGAKF